MTATKPKCLMQCPRCNGAGVIFRQTDQHLAVAPKEICDRCAGSGKVVLDPAYATERKPSL